MTSEGYFGNLFDYDGDGELNIFEQTADYLAFEDMMRDTKSSSDSDDDGYYDTFDDFDEDELDDDEDFNNMNENGYDSFGTPYEEY